MDTTKPIKTTPILEEKLRKLFVTTYRKALWRPFIKAIEEYGLIEENDRIGVIFDDREETYLLGNLLKEYELHMKRNVTVHFIMEQEELEQAIKELALTKIAFSHTFDSVVEHILYAMLYQGKYETLMPKQYLDKETLLQGIAPLYLIRRRDMKKWIERCELQGENIEESQELQEVQKILTHLKTINPQIEEHIFRSAQNVNLEALIGYEKDKKRYHFLEHYRERL